jgi:PAS domain S-box-containing protein
MVCVSAASAQGLKHLIKTVSAANGDPSTAREAIRALQSELGELEQMAEQLARTEENLVQFRRIFEQGPIGMAVLGTDGHLLATNPALCNLLGYGADQLSKLSLEELTHAEDRAIDLSQAKRLWAGECSSYKVQKRYLRKDGQIVFARLTASVLRDEAGEPLYGLAMLEDNVVRMVGLHTDITARMQQQEAAAPPRLTSGSVDLPHSSAHCKTCKSDLLVASRWRLWEWPMLLLLLQRPVRCCSCGRRGLKPLWARVPGRVEA